MALSEIDRNLLQRCLARKPRAWEDFVDRFTGLVVHVVNHSAQSRSLRLAAEDREDLIAQVDVALVDGTFFADGEIPGRSLADIPHPFVCESLARFGALPESERAKIHFTHLNHTNPAADPAGPAAAAVRAAMLGLL